MNIQNQVNKIVEISWVPVQHIMTLLSLAEGKVGSHEDLLASCDLPASLLETQSARVPFKSFIALSNAIMIAMDDESCGMLPKPIKPGSFALLCQSCIDCKTLGHFLRRRIKFLDLISDDIRVNLQLEGDVAHYEIAASDDSTPLSQHIMIIILVLAYKMGSWSIRERIPLISISVSGPRGKNAKGYDNLFDHQINFEQDQNQICFPAEYLDRPILQDAESMEQFLKAPAAYLMSEYGVRQSLAYDIKKLLQGKAATDFPGFETVASHFNFSVATLRRRLQDEGTTYQEIKNEVRLDFAVTILVREGNVKAAAYAAGFSEPTSFFRAFKRWTGTTPKAYIS